MRYIVSIILLCSGISDLYAQSISSSLEQRAFLAAQFRDSLPVHDRVQIGISRDDSTSLSGIILTSNPRSLNLMLQRTADDLRGTFKFTQNSVVVSGVVEGRVFSTNHFATLNRRIESGYEDSVMLILRVPNSVVCDTLRGIVQELYSEKTGTVQAVRGLASILSDHYSFIVLVTDFNVSQYHVTYIDSRWGKFEGTLFHGILSLGTNPDGDTFGFGTTKDLELALRVRSLVDSAGYMNIALRQGDTQVFMHGTYCNCLHAFESSCVMGQLTSTSYNGFFYLYKKSY